MPLIIIFFNLSGFIYLYLQSKLLTISFLKGAVTNYGKKKLLLKKIRRKSYTNKHGKSGKESSKQNKCK